MSTPDEDAVLAAAEQIARIALGDINIKEYQDFLFSTGAMLAVWRAAMVQAGYSEYLIEKSAWMILTSFFGHHITTEITFEPATGTYAEPLPRRVESGDQRGEGSVHGTP